MKHYPRGAATGSNCEGGRSPAIQSSNQSAASCNAMTGARRSGRNFSMCLRYSVPKSLLGVSTAGFNDHKKCRVNTTCTHNFNHQSMEKKKHWRLPAGIPNGMQSSATARGSNSSVRSKSGFAIQRFVLDKQTSGNTWLFLASKFGSDKGTISKLKAVLSTTSWPCWGCPGKKFSFISTPLNSSEFLRSSVKSWGAPGPPIPTMWKGQAPAWKPFLRLKLWRNLHNIIIHGCDKPTNWISLETFYLEEPNVQSLVSSILIANLFSSCGRCIAFAHSAMWPRSSEGVWTFWTRERWRASLPKHW